MHVRRSVADGDEVIAEVRAKVEALMSLQQPNARRDNGSRPASYFGSGRDPQGVRLVAVAMQLEHAVDEVLHRASLLRDSGEVAQVLLAGRDVLRRVRCPTLL
jgi:hypothetical protein